MAFTLGVLPAGSQVVAAAYGNGVFVALENATGYADTSPDGVTWTRRAMPAGTTNWGWLIFAAGVFVAGAAASYSGASVATSPDGITWTMRTTAHTMGPMAFSGGLIVSVGVGSLNFVQTSPDGITWTTVTNINTQLGITGNWQMVAYGGGAFVAVDNLAQQVVVSVDNGATWTLHALPAGLGDPYVNVVYGAGLFVAVMANENLVATSPDGATWTPRTLPATDVWWGAAFGGGSFFLAAQGSTNAATSPDGINWTLQTFPVSDTWQVVAFGSGAHVALAYAGAGTTARYGLLLPAFWTRFQRCFETDS